jgi:hypothetical protein
VVLEPGRYEVEWYNVKTRASLAGEPLAVAAASSVEVTAPFVGPAVLYLKSRESRVES